MNTPSVHIALPKLFLWSEAARIQEYPEAASRAEPSRVYSRADLERVVFDIAPTMEFKGGAPRGKGTDGVINTYGLERSGARYRINGINLFERLDKGLQATAEGVELTFTEDTVVGISTDHAGTGFGEVFDGACVIPARPRPAIRQCFKRFVIDRNQHNRGIRYRLFAAKQKSPV